MKGDRIKQPEDIASSSGEKKHQSIDFAAGRLPSRRENQYGKYLVKKSGIIFEELLESISNEHYTLKLSFNALEMYKRFGINDSSYMKLYNNFYKSVEEYENSSNNIKKAMAVISIYNRFKEAKLILQKLRKINK